MPGTRPSHTAQTAIAADAPTSRMEPRQVTAAPALTKAILRAEEIRRETVERIISAFQKTKEKEEAREETENLDEVSYSEWRSYFRPLSERERDLRDKAISMYTDFYKNHSWLEQLLDRTNVERVSSEIISYYRREAEAIIDIAGNLNLPDVKKSYIVKKLREDVSFGEEILGSYFRVGSIELGDSISKTKTDLAKDIDIQRAVEELRDQFHSSQVSTKPPYPGKRAGVDPINFLLEHYGDDIREGRLWTGTLAHLDNSLYVSVRKALSLPDPESGREPQSLTDFFQAHLAPEKRGTPLQRRLRAAAAILGASEEDAAKFFGTLRPDRVEAISRVRSR